LAHIDSGADSDALPLFALTFEKLFLDHRRADAAKLPWTWAA